MSGVTIVTKTITETPTSFALAGALLLLVIFFGALGMLSPWMSMMPAGLLAWAAGLLLWPFVPRQSKIQALVLFVIGFGLIGWVSLRGGSVPWRLLAEGNAPLIAMLAAVSFLQLIGPSGKEDSRHHPRGRKAVWQTLLGVHFVGAVTNLSTVFMMARALAPIGRPLGRRYYISLSRLFGAAAFWSPFFASMAATLTYAPGAQLTSLILFGLPLAAVALFLTVREVSSMGGSVGSVGVHDYRGYPVSVSSLWLPGLLALVILSLHAWDPTVSILGLISALVPAMVLMALALSNALSQTPTVSKLLPSIHQHVTVNLPRMNPELSLFLSAGVMAGGIAAAVTEFNLGFTTVQFGGPEAALLLSVLVAAAMVGVHPIIGVAASSQIVLPMGPDPSLLGSTFLAAWGIGVAASPLSGMNIALQGGFSLRVSDILKWNGYYAIIMVLAAGLLLQLHPAA